MNVFVFDIETVPDVDNGRRIYDIHGLSDEDTAEAMFQLRREKTGGADFLPLHLHKIIAISVVLSTSHQFKIWSLGETASSEKELIERFFTGLQKYKPVLVSWNGGNFDLPVLHYRSLLHGVTASRYWDTGDIDQELRWNNYLSRYHYRHTDLMDVLAAFQPRANAPLHDIALMLGLPGKMDITGNQVWDYYKQGQVETIRHYCETDVLNTYLIYLRFELIRGKLDAEQYQQACQQVRDTLEQQNQAHLREFLNAWKN